MNGRRCLNFVVWLAINFKNGDIHKRRDIIREIGSNLILMNEKLNVQSLHSFLLIENEFSAQNMLNDLLEPENRPVTPHLNPLSQEVILEMRAM